MKGSKELIGEAQTCRWRRCNPKRSQKDGQRKRRSSLDDMGSSSSDARDVVLSRMVSPTGMKRFLRQSSTKMKELSFDSLHSLHTSSTASTGLSTLSPGSRWDGGNDGSDSESDFEGGESFSCLGLDEEDEEAERELRSSIAKQALEDLRSRNEAVLINNPSAVKVTRQASFRGTLELIEE